MIASTIADIPGASAVLRGGAVTYCDEIKHRVLGVEQETLDRYTAVSHQTAREMASSSLELYQRDIAVSATGYAGPGGGTEDDPAGTFYIGWAHRSADGECRSWTLCAATMRATVRVFVPMRSRRHWVALPLCSTLWNRRVLKGPPGPLIVEIGTLGSFGVCAGCRCIFACLVHILVLCGQAFGQCLVGVWLGFGKTACI